MPGSSHRYPDATEVGAAGQWPLRSGRDSGRHRPRRLRRNPARRARLWPLVLAAGLAGVAWPAPAGAVEVFTDFPGVAISRGGTTTFDLTVVAPEPERVGLSVVEAPNGWRTTLRGGGSVVSAVFARPVEPPKVTLDVRAPGDASPGTYRVVVRAAGASGTSTLPLELTLAEDAPGAVELVAEFPTLRGATDATFKFDLTLRNASPRAVSFNLMADGPEGWKVLARPTAQQQAATVSVDPAGTATIQVEADPPPDLKGGKYPIRVQAVGGGETVQAELTAEVTGSVRLVLATANERLNLRGKAGGTTSVPLVVANDGSAPARGVRLSATPPTGWEVKFEPETLPDVPVRDRVPVTARIRPKGDAVAGDYAVTVTAASEGASETLDLRLAVGTSGWWGATGIIIVVAALSGLAAVYRRYGRR